MKKPQKTATELAELIAEHAGVDVWAVKWWPTPWRGGRPRSSPICRSGESEGDGHRDHR